MPPTQKRATHQSALPLTRQQRKKQTATAATTIQKYIRSMSGYDPITGNPIPLKNVVMLGNTSALEDDMRKMIKNRLEKPGVHKLAPAKTGGRLSVKVTASKAGAKVIAKPRGQAYRKSRIPFSRKALQKYIQTTGNDAHHPILRRPFTETEKRRIGSKNPSNKLPLKLSIFKRHRQVDEENVGKVYRVDFHHVRNADDMARKLNRHGIRYNRNHEEPEALIFESLAPLERHIAIGYTPNRFNRRTDRHVTRHERNEQRFHYDNNGQQVFESDYTTYVYVPVRH